jgi:hypothetical protein
MPLLLDGVVPNPFPNLTVAPRFGLTPLSLSSGKAVRVTQLRPYLTWVSPFGFGDFWRISLSPSEICPKRWIPLRRGNRLRRESSTLSPRPELTPKAHGRVQTEGLSRTAGENQAAAGPMH